MSEPADEERTDPHIAMPSGPPTEEIQLQADDEPEPKKTSATPSSPPPLPPSKPAAKPPFDRPFPASRPAVGGPVPARPISNRPGPMPARAVPASSSPPRPEALAPLRAKITTERPPERQRFAQMETQLDEARSSLARNRHELDELRTQLDAKEARIEAMLAELQKGDGREAIEAKLRELDERGDAFAEELRARLERADDRGEALAAVEARVRRLEESAELTRIRMRLELTGHQLKDALTRLEGLETSQAELGERLSSNVATERRLARLESLFRELTDELREQRDARDLDELRARLADVEALTLQTGSGLREQQSTLRELRESIKPPPRSPVPEEGLTRVKGIGPKFAKQLAQMGVTTVAQIAAWNDGDVQRAAVTLGITTARIEKAGWIQSARKLLEG